MNYRVTIIVILWLICLNTSSFAQFKEWKTEEITTANITVKSRISSRVTSSGEAEQLVEYVVTATAKASMERLISVVKDVSKHKDFMGQKTSLKIKSLSDSECIVYYFYKGFWPYPSSDIVAKMLFHEDTIKKIATFTLTAAPTLYDDKGVRRLDYYNLAFMFRALDDGNIEITITSKFTPAVQLPAFLVSTWFPDGPADYLLGIIRLANAGS